MKIKIPEPISGGLILSYRCTASCQHCMYACTPEWSNHWISRQDLYRILKQLAGKIKPAPYGAASTGLNSGLHFTGGEPFLNFELLCEAVEIAEDMGIPSTFVETNCYWAVKDDVTREKLNILKKKGLKGIMISVNPFYLEFVPFEYTQRAIAESMEIFGHNTMVYQLEYYRRFRSMGIKKRVPLQEYLFMERGKDFARNVEFFISGRAAYSLERLGVYPRYSAERLCKIPCTPSFLRTWHNHFDNYGNLIPGYCGGISLGDCRELDMLLEEGLESDEYPILTFLVKDDFEGLLSFAKSYNYCVNDKGYFSRCHLCIDIRKHLSCVGEFKELQPAEFYLHLEES